jgi:hypothetical protein
VGGAIAQVFRESGTTISVGGVFQAAFGTSQTPLYFLNGNESSEFTYTGSGFVDKDGDGIAETRNYCEIGGLGVGCNVGWSHLTNTNAKVMLIKFDSLSRIFGNARNNVVHELGHLFSNTVHGGFPWRWMPQTFIDHRSVILATNGRPPTFLYWQMNPDKTHSETYADMFLAWTFNYWGDMPGEAIYWMTTNLAEWIH